MNQSPASGRKAESEKGAAPIEFSEIKAYTRVVDRLGIAAISGRNRTRLFEKLRPLLREEGLTSIRNPLANTEFCDLVKLASHERPELAKEARRRILQFTRPHHYRDWMNMARISPPTEAELRKAAKQGLATPFIQRLRKKPIPKWLLVPTTLGCVYSNKPNWTHRIDELIAAGAANSDTLKLILTDAIRRNNGTRITQLLQIWPAGHALPRVWDLPSLAIAKELKQKDGACVPPEELARAYYRAGNKTEAFKILASLPKKYTSHSWLYAEGLATRDIQWITACGKNRDARTEILGGLMENRKEDYSDLVLKLLRRKEWLAIIQDPDPDRYPYPVDASFRMKNPTLRSLIISNVPSEVHIQEGVLRHQPEFLPDFLKLRPTNHNEDFWNAIKPAVAVKLVPLARKFNSDAAKEALRKAGRSLACAQHILAESDITFDVTELLTYPDCAALEVLKQGRINAKFDWSVYNLDHTKQKLSTIKKLLGPKTPWANEVKIENAIPFHMKAACLLVLIGYKPASLTPFLKEAISGCGELASSKELAKVVEPAIPGLTDAQLATLIKSSSLKAQAFSEVERRASKRSLLPGVAAPLGVALLKALLYSDRHDLFLKHGPLDLHVSADDMKRLITLQQWDAINAIRKEQPLWQQPCSTLFCEETREHWEKLVESGFRIEPECCSKAAIELFLDKGLFSEEQLNAAGIEAAQGRSGCIPLLPRIYPAPRRVQGGVIDIYNAGKLNSRYLERAILKGRNYKSNLAAVHQMLTRLQRQSSQSRRACILENAEEENRWGLLGLQPPCQSLREMNPYGFSLTSFKPILGALLHECLRAGTDPSQVLEPAFNLSVAFGNLTEVRKVLHKRNLPSKAPLHDLGQFNLPSKGTWNIGAWRQLLLHHSGRGLKVINLAPNIEGRLGRVPKDMDEAEHAAVLSAYTRGEENIELAKLCYTHHQDEDQFEDYLELMGSAKDEDLCPNIRLNGADLGDPNLVFRRLQPKDPRGPLLGEITNCCQHLGGVASDCAEAGTLDPEASFYVLERRGVIIAQSFAWRTKSSLVFDSWERLSHDYDPLCQPVLVKAAEKALELDSSLEDIRLGAGGGTPKLALEKVQACSWKRKLNGMDSSSQYLLAQRTPPFQQVLDPARKGEHITA